MTGDSRFQRLRCRVTHWVGLVLTLGLLVSPMTDPLAATVCRGHFINPVTDVCWSCLFPVKIATTLTIPSPAGTLPDIDTNAAPVCSCGTGLNRRVGLNMSYWEPMRTAEIVQEPGCSPTLGGISLGNPLSRGAGGTAVAKARIEGVKGGRHHRGMKPTQRDLSFSHVHWFMTPWLFITESLLDSSCLDAAPFDLAYLSELDPLWNDSIASFVLAPEASLFANPIAQTACITDCAAASLGLPINTLFWCAGCQGGLYPLTGFTSSLANPVARWHLLTERFATKLAREGLLWTQLGSAGQCGPAFQPILRKDSWRFQVIYPQGMEPNRPCCRPWGRTVQRDLRVLPPAGSDGAILLWGRKDCCESVRPTSLLRNPTGS